MLFFSLKFIMSAHNIAFYQDLTNLSLNYHQISLKLRLISSSELYVFN